MLLFVLIKEKIFSLSACLIRNQQDVLSVFLAGKQGDEISRERRFYEHIGAIMLALPEGADRGMLGVSKGRSGNSASIWGEGMLNKGIFFHSSL